MVSMKMSDSSGSSIHEVNAESNIAMEKAVIFSLINVLIVMFLSVVLSFIIGDYKVRALNLQSGIRTVCCCKFSASV